MARKKDMVTVVCYGDEEVMERKEALAKYREGARCSEGAERDRYMKIVCDLMDGLTVCTDQW